MKLAAVLLTVIAVCPVFGQTGSATLSGSVTDPSGAAVVNAEVRLLNVETNSAQTTRTNASGVYVFTALPPGRYQLTSKSDGFKVVVSDGLILHVQDTATVNLRMEIGSAGESITVSADSMLINTQDASVGTVVERQIVENMPLNGRSFQGLITLTPGVNTVAAGANTPGQFVVNGQRSDTNYFTVDGVSANVAAPVLGAINANGAGATPSTTAGGGFNNMVSIDAMQEFRISTSTFAPEYGRTPGAQVSLSSRSGTNTFHGDAFEYLRNTVLDANDWFLNAQGKPRGIVRQNDFGGVVGGPVVKNKLFFFASYEGLRLAAPSPSIKAVPTQQARTLAASMNDNGVIGYMAQFLNAYPLPDGNLSTPCTSATTCVGTYTATLPGTASLDGTSIRADYGVNDRNKLFGRYSHSPSNTTSASSVFATSIRAGNDVYTAGWSDALGGSMNNDLRFNFTHTTFVLVKNPLNFKGDLSTIFPAGYAQPPSSYRLSQMSIQLQGFPGGIDSFQMALANANNGNDQINVIETFSYLRGSHLLKFGADFRQLNPSIDQSNFNWNNQFTGTNNCPGGTPAYICGLANLSNIQHNVPQNFRFREFSFFVQDSWKLNNRLTLTYGLRYEINPAAESINGHPGFSLDSRGFNLNDLSNFKLNPFGSAIYATRWHNVAPRVGIAYQLSASQNWGRVVRAGYGIFYDTGHQVFALVTNPYSARTNNLTLGPPTVPLPVSLSNAQFVTPPDANLTLPINGQSDFLVDPTFNLPYVHQTNFSVEQQLGARQSLTVSYIGAFGKGLIGQVVIPPNKGNPNVLGAGGIGDTLNIYGNYSSSDYNALQVKFQRQFSHGFGALGTYTWSHSLDDASTNVSTNISGGSPVSLPTTAMVASAAPFALLRGNSDFDVRHSVGVSIVYEIPTFSQNTLVQAIFRNWSIDPIYHYQAGVPIDVIANSNGTLGGLSSLIQRPQLISGVPVELSCPGCPGGKAINTAPVTAAAAAAAGCAAPTATNAKGAFCTPLNLATQAISGNVGRNVLRGFPLGELDFSLHRDFPFTESIRLRFQADAFSVFNHPNFGPPVANMFSSLFGVATSMANTNLGAAATAGAGFNPLFNTGGPRNFQFALKLYF